jgi:hypothetical protein
MMKRSAGAYCDAQRDPHALQKLAAAASPAADAAGDAEVGDSAPADEPESGCGICGDAFIAVAPETPVSVLACRHAFCAACIARWFASAATNSCPVCRRVYSGLRSAKTSTAAELVAATAPGPPKKKKRAAAAPANTAQAPAPAQRQLEPASEDPELAAGACRWNKKAGKSRAGKKASAMSLRRVGAGPAPLQWLQGQCAATGLPQGGTKAELCERLARHELGRPPAEDVELEVAVCLDAVVTALEDAAAKEEEERRGLLEQLQQDDAAVLWMVRARFAVRYADPFAAAQWRQLQALMLVQQEQLRVRNSLRAAGFAVPSQSVV